MSLLKIAIASLVVGLIGLTSSAGPKESTRERGESSAGPAGPAGLCRPLTLGFTIEEIESNLNPKLRAKYRRYMNFYTRNLGSTTHLTALGDHRTGSIPRIDECVTILHDLENIAIIKVLLEMREVQAQLLQAVAEPEAQTASGSSAEFVYKPLAQGITLEEVESNLEKDSVGTYKRYIGFYKKHMTGTTDLTTMGYKRLVDIPKLDKCVQKLQSFENSAKASMNEKMQAEAEVQRQVLQAVAQMESGSSVRSIYHPLTPHLTLEALVSNLNHNLLSEWLRSLHFLYLYATGQVNQQNFPHVDYLRLRVFELEKSAINKIQRKIEAIAASGWSEYQPLRGDVTMNDVESNLHWKDLAEYRDNFEYLHMHRTPETEDPIKLSNIPSEENVIKNIIRLETVAINNKREAQPPTSTSGGGAN